VATTILLVRHAAHPLLGRVLCGRMPGVALDETGRAQAAILARDLAASQPHLLLTSPVERARETAAAIATATGLPAQPCDALDEIDFGAWTGARFADLADDPAWSCWNEERADGCPPGGEPMRQAQARVVAAIQRIRASHPDGIVVAVSHADIIKSVLLWCLGLTLDAHARFDIDPASTSGIALWEGGGKLLWMNRGVTA
jgi:probable phosphoglycerate mutase